MRISLLIAAAAACTACSSEARGGVRANADVTARQCSGAATQSCGCGSGTGMQTCSASGTWNACQCTTVPNDFGNPDSMTPVVDAGPIVQERPTENCSPGLYLGTYDCEIMIFGLPFPLAGDVSFNLSINEMTIDQECADGEEFCADLVISENGGTLFGFAGGFYGFETMLAGALDCATGEFRAMGVDGRWGNAISEDPNDPNAFWTVMDPPIGMFDGTLSGLHEKSGSSETIAGTWDLTENTMDINCAGPFTVTLQP